MEENLKELYLHEIERSRLDFDSDPEYQAYYTQAEALWEGGDTPLSYFTSWTPAASCPSPTASAWARGWPAG